MMICIEHLTAGRHDRAVIYEGKNIYSTHKEQDSAPGMKNTKGPRSLWSLAGARNQSGKSQQIENEMRRFDIIKINPLKTRQDRCQKKTQKQFFLLCWKVRCRNFQNISGTYPHKCIWPPVQPKSHEGFGQCQLNSSCTRGSGGCWALSSAFTKPYIKFDKTQHLLPRVPCSDPEQGLKCLAAEAFCQRCSQPTWGTVLLSQVLWKIGIACNHSNLISGVCKLLKCRCRLYSQGQAESLLKIYILHLFLFHNPNVFF